MTPFERFCSRSKMRHDFGDKIQVRYLHSNGEAYDTWVSGEETLQRLNSQEAEERLRRLSDLDRETLRQARDSLPDKVRDRLEKEAQERLSGAVSDWLGGNPVGDALTDAVAGKRRSGEVQDEEKEQWQERLHDPAFRRRALELAWINLRGSFPPDEQAADDDWV